MTTLTFNNTTLNTINQDKQIWLTSSDLAKALGYKQADSITKIFNRNKDEFSPSMSQTVNSTASAENKGLTVKTRIFSLNGCHLIAMFARTDIAKEFRKWVLDILDKEVGNPQLITELTPEQTLPLRNAVNSLVTKAGIMYPEAYKMVHERFNVSHIKQLQPEQVAEAVEYVHKLLLAYEPTIDNLPAYEYLTTAKHEALEYVWELQSRITKLGGELPAFPNIDKEQLAQSFITRLLMNNRVMLSFGDDGVPSMRFVPTEHYVVSPNNLNAVVESVNRKLLPDIIETAVKRLAK